MPDSLLLLPSAAQANLGAQRDRLRLLVGFAREKARKWHAAVDEYERDYFMAVTGDKTPNKRSDELVRLSDLGNIAEAGKNMLIRSAWKVYVDRAGDLARDKTKSGLVEVWLRNMVRQIEDRTGEDLEMQLADYQMRLSAAVMHWAYNPQPLVITEEFGAPQNRAPIEAWVIDPRHFFPMPGGPEGRFEYVVHIEKRPLVAALQLAEGQLADSTLALQQLQEYYGHILPEYWYTTEFELCNYWGWHNVEGTWRVVNAVLYGDALLRPFQVMPGYTRLPWDIAPARDTRHKDLEYRWLPYTYHARPHVRQAEKLQGMANTVFEKGANAPFAIELDAQFSDPPEIVSGRDQFIFLKPGQKFTVPPITGLPRDFFAQMELTNQRIQETGFPRGVFGITGTGQGMNSGYGYEQQQEGGILRMGEPAEHLARLLARFFRATCSLVARHDPGSVVAATYSEETGERVLLTGQELVGWEIDVKWRTELPGEKMRKIAMATQAVGSMLTSAETARELFLDLEDPKREADLILTEKVMNSHPDITRARAFDLLAQWDALPNFDEAARAELQMEVDRVVSILGTTGAPPEIIEQAVQRVIQKKHAELMMQYMMMGQPGQGQPPMGQEGQGNHGAKPNNDLQRQFNNPLNGQVGPQRAGQAPAGNPQDISAPYRSMANDMRIKQ